MYLEDALQKFFFFFFFLIFTSKVWDGLLLNKNHFWVSNISLHLFVASLQCLHHTTPFCFNLLWLPWLLLRWNIFPYAYLTFFLLKNFFNWRLITLQYWGGFCHTVTWTSHGCTCVPHPEPPSPSHPSGSSQCTSPEHPVSCIKPGLVVCFTDDNIHVSMLFSQIIPPSPSPRVQKSVLYICVSFAVSHIGYLTFLLSF